MSNYLLPTYVLMVDHRSTKVKMVQSIKIRSRLPSRTASQLVVEFMKLTLLVMEPISCQSRSGR